MDEQSIRVRVVRYVVKIEAMADDGEHLRPLNIDAQVIEPEALSRWVSDVLPIALADLTQRINEPSESTVPLNGGNHDHPHGSL